MAFRELTMMDVKEVLRRWQAEHTERRIAREAGCAEHGQTSREIVLTDVDFAGQFFGRDVAKCCELRRQ